MAEALYHLGELGGADFELRALMPDGTRVELAGEVDWVSHTGRADVRIDATADAAVTEVYWTQQVVLERIPSLTQLAGTVGEGVSEYYLRPPAVADRHLDAMIQLVTSLGAERRDDAILIAQKPGTAWLRADTIPGTDLPADVLRYGQRTVYWLDRDGIVLHRFEGNDPMGTRPIVIDLLDHGRREVEFPGLDEIFDATSIPDPYAAATAVSPP